VPVERFRREHDDVRLPEADAMETKRPFMDYGRKVMSGELPAPPIGSTIGFRIAEIGADRAVFEMEAVMDRHANPMGTLHGGVLCDISDGAMGMAWATELDEGESFTTLELKISFLRPVWKGTLRAEARVVKRGKSVGLVECDILNEKNDLVARASCTQMTLRGEHAKGR
jgi:uncharacterized protein (TIGR00369 family)